MIISFHFIPYSFDSTRPQHLCSSCGPWRPIKLAAPRCSPFPPIPTTSLPCLPAPPSQLDNTARTSPPHRCPTVPHSSHTLLTMCYSATSPATAAAAATSSAQRSAPAQLATMTPVDASATSTSECVDRSSAQCCHCGYRNAHAPDCPFKG